MNTSPARPPLARAGRWLAALLLLPALAQAGIVREATLDAQSYSASPIIPGFLVTSNNTAEIVASVAPRLDTDFASVGETELTFTLTAPLGMRFHVSLPLAGFFSARYEGGSSTVTAGAVNATATIAFAGFGGDAIATPTTPSISLTGPPSGIFTPDSYYARAEWSFAAGTDFWFENLSITALIPAGYNTDLSGGPAARAYIHGSITTDYETDLGQFVYLEAIPSASGAVALPAGWLLFGLGGLLLARNRRHAGL